MVKKIIEIDNDNFFEEIFRHKGFVITFFYSNVYSGKEKNIINDFFYEYSALVKFSQLDIRKYPEIADSFDINGTLSVVLIRNGSVISECRQCELPDDLKNILEKFI